MTVTDHSGKELRAALRKAMVESITKGSLHEHPYLELRNVESGDVLYRVDIHFYESRGEIFIRPLHQDLNPLMSGFANKLTLCNRDGLGSWSMPPATRESVTELVPVEDWDDYNGDLSYEEWRATTEMTEITVHLPPRDGFVILTPECPSVEKAWRDGGYHLHPDQPISIALPAFTIS